MAQPFIDSIYEVLIIVNEEFKTIEEVQSNYCNLQSRNATDFPGLDVGKLYSKI